MSAFTPYQKTPETTPQQLTNLHGFFEVYKAALCSYKVKPTVNQEERGSKFLIENILRDDNEKKVTDVKINEAKWLESVVSNLGKTEVGHRCMYCGKIYTRKYGLKIHTRTHTGYKPLKCKFCFRPFGDPSNLNKHVRLHIENKSSQRCKECGKLFVRKRDFDRHVDSRHRIQQIKVEKMHNQMNVLEGEGSSAT